MMKQENKEADMWPTDPHRIGMTPEDPA